ncbi:MAG: peptide-methionine (S)-S-oxide reductase, partial [Stellaceae bacterium]
TQYRSEIYFTTPAQGRIARAYIGQLTTAKSFAKPIVTKVAPFTTFYPAEAYHQDFALHHPNYPYIVINDLPKVANLREDFPHLYVPYKGS